MLLCWQVGTWLYMAPEMIEGHVLPYRVSYLSCDVYSLALLLWEMLARTEALPSCTPRFSAPLMRALYSYGIYGTNKARMHSAALSFAISCKYCSCLQSLLLVIKNL